MATVTITSNTGTYSADGYLVDNDPWNAGDQINGVDYTDTISLNTATFPDGVLFSWSWSWPLADAGTVQAYPHINYTPTNSSGDAIAPTVGDLADFSTTYSFSISGDTQEFNVAWDLWLTNPATQATDEIMLWVHSPQYPMGSNQPYQFTASSIVDANIFIANVGWTYVAIQTPTDQLSGTISLSDVFKTLIWDGVLTGNETLDSIQVGAEVQAGTGSLEVNDLSYSLSTNATVEGTSGNDTFALTNIGGVVVVGDGGTDTAVFSGLYSDYSIKNTGSETLITYGSDVSTLDELQGVKFIQFADGIYNTVTSTFAPTSNAPTVTSVDGKNHTIANGTTLTILTPAAGTETFAGHSGALVLDDSIEFGGGIAGFGGQDAILLSDLAFGPTTTLGYTATGSDSGTLSVSSGNQTVRLAMIGNYVSSSFVTASDGFGGSLITEAAQTTLHTSLIAAHVT